MKIKTCWQNRKIRIVSKYFRRENSDFFFCELWICTFKLETPLAYGIKCVWSLIALPDNYEIWVFLSVIVFWNFLKKSLFIILPTKQFFLQNYIFQTNFDFIVRNEKAEIFHSWRNRFHSWKNIFHIWRNRFQSWRNIFHSTKNRFKLF